LEKVLIVTLNSCYPLTHGGAVAQYFFLEGLQNKVQFVLCTIARSEKERKDLELLQKKLPTMKIYFLDEIPALKNHGLIEVIKSILRKTRNLFSTGRNEISDSITSGSDDFEDPYFQRTDFPHNNRYIELINKVIRDENIKLVQFEFYDTIDLCFAVPADIYKIFIHHELRFKRLKMASKSSPLTESYKNYLIARSEQYERMCLRNMDQVVVFNEDDARLLDSSDQKIQISPYGIPDELIFNNQTSNDFNRFLIIGGENHNPNKLGLAWFLDTIFIPNYQFIDWPVIISGEWSLGFRNKYKKYSRIIFIGLVNSLENVFKKSVLINPVLTGSGLRTKVLQAFANGVPVLSTRFGAEGCLNQNNKHVGLFDNADEFLTLIGHENYFELAKFGFEFYTECFNRQFLLDRRLDIYRFFS
jgi:glycosyltransferase involved in cell wall biosynthesis